MTIQEKAEWILKDIKEEQGTNPVHIFKQMAHGESICSLHQKPSVN